ncbi:alpha/beta hydrolase [bacterium]|nr:MAG: alpha/beta hydrolase [bacterium]
MFLPMIAAAAIGIPGGTPVAPQNVKPRIVLVHGAFVDGSGWMAVYKILKQDGYDVSIVQHPTITLAGDVAATKLVVGAGEGPVLLVGHSYGGTVISEVGNDPRVIGLVYITAFAPDKGESIVSILSGAPAGGPVPPVLPPKDGFLFIDPAKMPAAFAADVDAPTAAFMAASQVPWGVECRDAKISEPAWKAKPSWYLAVTDDKMVPLSVQRMMAKRAGASVTEVLGSHAIYMSNPKAVASIIEKAATGVASPKE